MSLLSSWR